MAEKQIPLVEHHNYRAEDLADAKTVVVIRADILNQPVTLRVKGRRDDGSFIGEVTRSDGKDGLNDGDTIPFHARHVERFIGPMERVKR